MAGTRQDDALNVAWLLMPHAGLSTSETGDLLGFSQPALEFKKTGLRKVNAH